MNPNEILEVLEKKGAIERGHFRLSSGLHSDLYVQKFRVFEHPRLTQRFGEALAALFEEGFDAVVSPALGAVVLGFATALAVDARFLFAERTDGAMALRRGFELAPRERVLVVEDVVTTGGSAREVIELAESAGGEVIGVAALIDRTDRIDPPSFGTAFKALLTLDASSWEAGSCALCRAGEPIVEPGSRGLTT